MCVNKVKGKKRVNPLFQLGILSLFPSDILLHICWKMKLSISGELNTSICVSILLSVEVFVQQEAAVRSPHCK